jgi:hypothetical protein
MQQLTIVVTVFEKLTATAIVVVVARCTAMTGYNNDDNHNDNAKDADEKDNYKDSEEWH